jgi:hypothetical protein
VGSTQTLEFLSVVRYFGNNNANKSLSLERKSPMLAVNREGLRRIGTAELSLRTGCYFFAASKGGRAWSRRGSGQNIAEVALNRTFMEGRFALGAKLELLQAQHGQAVLAPHKRPVDNHLEREQALQRNRPRDAQLKLHSAGKFLIALKANRFVAEISRPARSMPSAFPMLVRKLKFEVQFVPRPRSPFGC